MRHPHNKVRPRSLRSSESGYVLLAALWLLLLAASVAAFLMARSYHAAREAGDQQQQVQQRFALESAVETYVAEILINGPRSQWALLPSSGEIIIGGDTVQLQATAENGRLDVNSAELDLIDDVLRGLDYAGAERARLIAALEARRAAARPVGSMAELRELLTEAEIDGARSNGPSPSCLADMLTPYSGLAVPRDQVAPSGLRDAMARVGRLPGAGNAGAVAVSAVEPVRLVATAESGRIAVVLRITGQPDAPAVIHHWSHRPFC